MAKTSLRSEASARAVRSCVRVHEGRVRIALHIKPKARPERLEEEGEGLLLRVSAPPVDGKANQRVIELLAARLGVAKRAITLVRGESARHKELEIDGLELEEVVSRLSG